MDFQLSPEQKLLQQTIKEFADQEIMPGARDRDRNCEFPADIVAKLGALGYLGPLTPEKYGGMGADYLTEAILFDEIGRADSSVRTTLSVQISLCQAPILKYGAANGLVVSVSRNRAQAPMRPISRRRAAVTATIGF
jgi:alkylation response protein AidB-like acyl-CoA dehydrogenase